MSRDPGQHRLEVEQVERFHVELAVEAQALAGVDEVRASLRQHARYFVRHRCTTTHTHTQYDNDNDSERFSRVHSRQTELN